MKKRERNRDRESASTSERGETHMGTKREVEIACHSVPPQWCHSGDATSNREREGERERDREREAENRERKREEGTKKRERNRDRESASTSERGETHTGTEREVKTAWHSVPPQWYHSGDVSGNRERL